MFEPELIGTVATLYGVGAAGTALLQARQVFRRRSSCDVSARFFATTSCSRAAERVPGIVELRQGLYRWTARHPAWQPGAEPGSPGDWPPEVGCAAFAIERGMVVVDPQVPPDEVAFWAQMDPLVAAAGGRVWMLQTVRWHGRSRERFVERYDANCPPIMAAEIDGMRPLPFREADETMVWLERPRALIPGDRLIGTAGGGVRMCPQSWLDYLPNRLTVDRLRDLLMPLLDLPIELILVSHGEPVLADGHAQLRAALAA